MCYLTDLESDRLYYRPLIREDATIWTEFLSDAESMKFFPKLEVTPSERAVMWIDSQLERYEKGLYGMMAILLKDSNEFIGQCGLLTQEVDGKTELEVGYHLIKKYTGNGYATEAAIHFKNFGFKSKLASSIISIIVLDNYASQAVAKRNGMKEDFRTIWKEMDVIIFRALS